ncbi:MAG: alpha-galactosidase [Firmicutes bacterium]|nr:alpha-galactosidase [Bacillota bacterium]
MIRIIKNEYFILDTKRSTYAFRVLPTGQLEHLYYGWTLSFPEDDEEAVRALSALTEKHAFQPGNSCAYDQDHLEYTLDDMRLEASWGGKGDLREPFVEIVHSNGGRTSDFRFQSAEASVGKEPLETLPSSYDEKNAAGCLAIELFDPENAMTLELRYYVFEDCDVITRTAKLVNEGSKDVTVLRLMSAQLDFDLPGYVFTTFHGAWAREMQREDRLLSSGKLVNDSFSGTSSSRANPFVMLHPAETTEDQGDCYACNLIYSGNHYEAVEVNGFGKTRFVCGINPRGFAWNLAPGEAFEAPEAVLTYSAEGFNGMSRNMHRFVRDHIVRGPWKKRERPVLLNSWEAAYFDISEAKLLKLAKAAKDVGVELFVMDDGWFGKRNDDKSSLGDWSVNLKKLPKGLRDFSDKIRDLGLDFGIWVEPEMVSVDSDLYRAHPDWAMENPFALHSEGRNQRVLDLANPEVREYIVQSMTSVFEASRASYVKWDMNRPFSDVYSKALPPERQGEVFHRYVLGLYEIMGELVNRFPDILFEGCASGGNRFDLGILSYFPQIWASDDTDPVCRASIQTGYSYGYPMSTVSAHVSASPNHQTLRETPLETRFNVAAFGVLGYELNLCDLKKEELTAIKNQIALYKKWRKVFQFGEFYRGRAFQGMETNGVSRAGVVSAGGYDGNLTEWTVVSPDRTAAIGFLMQKLAVPNTQFHTYYAKGLDANAFYHFYNRTLKYDVRSFGDLINTQSPIHLKQDSVLLNVVAKFLKMDGETEDLVASGGTLMYGGVHLKQAFGGTGYSDEVRFFQDFGSRLYLMELHKKPNDPSEPEGAVSQQISASLKE